MLTLKIPNTNLFHYSWLSSRELRRTIDAFESNMSKAHEVGTPWVYPVLESEKEERKRGMI